MKTFTKILVFLLFLSGEVAYSVPGDVERISFSNIIGKCDNPRYYAKNIVQRWKGYLPFVDDLGDTESKNEYFSEIQLIRFAKIDNDTDVEIWKSFLIEAVGQFKNDEKICAGIISIFLMSFAGCSKDNLLEETLAELFSEAKKNESINDFSSLVNIFGRVIKDKEFLLNIRIDVDDKEKKTIKEILDSEPKETEKPDLLRRGLNWVVAKAKQAGRKVGEAVDKVKQIAQTIGEAAESILKPMVERVAPRINKLVGIEEQSQEDLLDRLKKIFGVISEEDSIPFPTSSYPQFVEKIDVLESTYFDKQKVVEYVESIIYDNIILTISEMVNFIREVIHIVPYATTFQSESESVKSVSDVIYMAPSIAVNYGTVLRNKEWNIILEKNEEPPLILTEIYNAIIGRSVGVELVNNTEDKSDSYELSVFDHIKKLRLDPGFKAVAKFSIFDELPKGDLKHLSREKDVSENPVIAGNEDGFQNEEAESDFLMAIRYAPRDIVISMIDNGADLNQQDATGRTVLDIAKERGDKELVDHLERRGATQSIAGNGIIQLAAVY